MTDKCQQGAELLFVSELLLWASHRLRISNDSWNYTCSIIKSWKDSTKSKTSTQVWRKLWQNFMVGTTWWKRIRAYRSSKSDMQEDGRKDVLNYTCVPPKFACWNPNSQGDDVWRWGLWEVIRWWGWCPRDGISVLLRGETESFLLFLLAK